MQNPSRSRKTGYAKVMKLVKKTLGMVASAVVLLSAGCSADSFEGSVVQDAQTHSEITINAPDGVQWSHGSLICPYMPLEDIDPSYRDEFTEEDLINDSYQWLAFTTVDGVAIERLSRETLNFCGDFTEAKFTSESRWSVTEVDGTYLSVKLK